MVCEFEKEYFFTFKFASSFKTITSHIPYIDLVQRVHNHAARLITGNFNHKNCRGIELVKSLNLYTIRDGKYYFLAILRFKSINRITPTYHSDRIAMNFVVNGYDTRGYGIMNPQPHPLTHPLSYDYLE